MKSKAFFLWLLLLVSTLWMVGCEKEGSTSPQSQVNQNKELVVDNPLLSVKNVKANLPIPIEEGKFDKVYGWIDSQTIIYTTNIQNHSNVYAYNLNEGTNRLIMKMESMIASINTSNSGEYLLIHSSSSPSESIITIIHKSGKEVYSEKIEAFDIAIEWNPYDEKRILISTFAEDWQDQTFELSLTDQKMTEIELSNPFSFWLSENELIFLDWVQDDVSLFADLVIKDLSSGVEKKGLPNIFQMDTFKNTFMTITVDQDQMNDVMFQFYDQNVNSIGSFSMPKLTRFSDWLVPFYDFNELENEFIALRPLYSGEVSTYTQGFQLFKYELDRNESNLIMEGLDNEPLSCSPDGNLCLYGYYLEKLIDLENKIIIQLTA